MGLALFGKIYYNRGCISPYFNFFFHIQSQIYYYLFSTCYIHYVSYPHKIPQGRQYLLPHFTFEKTVL